MLDQNKVVEVWIGSDGPRDYVRLPDGRMKNLGYISLASFVKSCCTEGTHKVNEILGKLAFNKETSFWASLQKVYEVFEPKRKFVMSSSHPLIHHEVRTFTTGRSIMALDDSTLSAIDRQVALIEKQISEITKHLKESPGGIGEASMKSDIEALRLLVKNLKAPSPYGNQGENSTYYGLPSSKLASAEEKVAYDILKKIDKTASKIDSLVHQGKRFNASKAREDLRNIAANVAELSEAQDISKAASRIRLAALDAQVSKIYKAFGSPQ